MWSASEIDALERRCRADTCMATTSGSQGHRPCCSRFTNARRTSLSLRGSNSFTLTTIARMQCRRWCFSCSRGSCLSRSPATTSVGTSLSFTRAEMLVRSTPYSCRIRRAARCAQSLAKGDIAAGTIASGLPVPLKKGPLGDLERRGRVTQSALGPEPRAAGWSPGRSPSNAAGSCPRRAPTDEPARWR